jgi:hypothetical protein
LKRALIMTQLLDKQSIIDALKALPKEDVTAIQTSVREHIRASRKPRVKKRRYTCAITDTIIIADDNPSLTFYVQKDGTQNANKLSMAPMVAGEHITRPRKSKTAGNGNDKELPVLTALSGDDKDIDDDLDEDGDLDEDDDLDGDGEE